MTNQATVLTHHAREFLKKNNGESQSNNEDQQLIKQDSNKYQLKINK